MLSECDPRFRWSWLLEELIEESGYSLSDIFPTCRVDGLDKCVQVERPTRPIVFNVPGLIDGHLELSATYYVPVGVDESEPHLGHEVRGEGRLFGPIVLRIDQDEYLKATGMHVVLGDSESSERFVLGEEGLTQHGDVPFVATVG